MIQNELDGSLNKLTLIKLYGQEGTVIKGKAEFAIETDLLVLSKKDGQGHQSSAILFIVDWKITTYQMFLKL